MDPSRLAALTNLTEERAALGAIIAECWTRHADLTARIDDLLDGSETACPTTT